MCIFSRPKPPPAPDPLPPAPTPPAPPLPPPPLPDPKPVTTDIQPKVRRAKTKKTTNQYAKGTGQLRINRNKTGVNMPTDNMGGGVNT